jgi:hypothetical protein
MKFAKKVLQMLTYGDAPDEFEVIEEKIADTSRWSVCYKMVFKYDGKFYATSFRRGATEMQDESPYEYDGDEIECKEVAPVEKTIIVYEPIK